MKTNIIKIIIASSMLTLLVHCQPISEGGDELAGLNSGLTDAPGGNGEIEVLANKRTASVVRSERALSTLVSCLGTTAASSAAKQAWEDNKGSISVEGDANSITPPMLVAIAKISGEVCNDLVQKERILAADQRRIFNQIDFTQGPNAVSSLAIQNSVRRLARSCWGRNETGTENQLITASVQSAFTNTTNSQQTINQMIYLCTAVASSFATFEM